MTALSALALLTGCCGKSNKHAALPLDTALTAEQAAARQFTPEVMWKMGRVGNGALSADGSRVLYTVTYYSVSENRSATSLWIVGTDGAGRKELIAPVDHLDQPQWNADGTAIYFLSDRDGSNQLWSIRADGSKLRQISAIEGGIEAFGMAPDEANLWYTRTVPVEKLNSKGRYPDLASSKARIYDDLMVRHWDTWEDGSYSHLFLAPFDGKKVGQGIDLIADEPWDLPMAPYFEPNHIRWNNAGTAIAYSCKKLRGTEYALSTNSDIYLYTLQSKETRNLTEEMPGYDRFPVFSPDDRQLAWISLERAGNEADKERLFTVNLETGEKRNLSEGFDNNVSDPVWSEDGNSIYLLAAVQATFQIGRADIIPRPEGNDTGYPISLITSGSQDYTSLSVAGSHAVSAKTTLSQAPELELVSLADGSATPLTAINKAIYDGVDMGQVQCRWITTTDDKQMLTWVVLPPNFDPNKKYPVLLYCQGGPQSVISQRWSYRWNFQLMASQGYIVVAPNRRGLPSFGQEWNDQISGDYSGQNIRDYLSAIDTVAAEPWADADRMGCIGASYGGYSAFYLAGHHQKRFKAFIAHCGMFNLESFYCETEELWFPNYDLGGPYWDKTNATAQRSFANSPHKAVDQWDTPILIVTGERDYRIPYTQSLQAFTAARLRGVPARLVSFEDEAHQVFKPQNSLVWNREFFGWLDKYLKQ